MCWFSGNLYPFDGSYYMSLDFVRYGLFFINFNFNLFFSQKKQYSNKFMSMLKKETRTSASSESVSKSLRYYYRIF